MLGDHKTGASRNWSRVDNRHRINCSPKLYRGPDLCEESSSRTPCYIVDPQFVSVVSEADKAVKLRN